MTRRYRSVLVVEDDPDIRQTIMAVLDAEGYEVFLADDGREALRRLQVIPKPCLILTDLMMPGMNGWQFIEHLEADHDFAVIPVIVMSAAGNHSTVLGKRFIGKPFELDHLIKAVRSMCELHQCGRGESVEPGCSSIDDGTV